MLVLSTILVVFFGFIPIKYSSNGFSCHLMLCFRDLEATINLGPSKLLGHYDFFEPDSGDTWGQDWEGDLEELQ